ncbi:oxidoreductase [Gillisia limnaea]|uniref:Oxidoreductase domain protein n=1 Tax=Gillisia limnaea (strain DSM 15749 / LMG 21470 / R-8282) TaxID=865937 RepID=H2BS33_GILLR|nr:oxidoreductase [Gillisia limnaea]EHQ03559.1 oxidoreductase domain protein [Gillisia limnaea DSM 15749]
MKQIQVAMAGFGKGGSIYNAPIISSIAGLEITKILTTSAENIKSAKQDFPEAEVVSEYDTILQDREIDLVIITTPNHFHKEFVEKALNAGKNVVVEKPFTPSIQEANELTELANSKNKILSIHHNRRFDSDFQTIQKLLQEQKLGEVVLYEAHFDRFRTEVKNSWKEEKENAGSGILYDLGSHLIDQALVLFGLPSEVFADIRIQRENAKVPDYFELLLLYPNLKVSLNAGMLVKEKGPTFSIHGTKGSYIKYGDDPQEEQLKNGQKPNELSDWGIESKNIWGTLNTIDETRTLESERGDYRIFYQNIYNAITGNEALLVKPEQARDVIKVIELAIQSNAEKRRVEYSSPGTAEKAVPTSPKER